MIDSIRKAEANAKSDKAEAAAEAKRIVAEAADNAKSGYEAAVAAAERDMADKLMMIESQSEALLIKNIADAEAEAAKEIEGAFAHMSDAVAIIIGELTKNVGK